MKRSKKLITVVILIVAFIPCFCQPAQNQPKGNLFVHDPVMIKEGDTYYVFHTGKGVGIKTSKDRKNWNRAGSVFADSLAWWKNDIPNQRGDLWAPDIHYRDGKFHLYYSVSA